MTYIDESISHTSAIIYKWFFITNIQTVSLMVGLISELAFPSVFP